jgi:hypothetical protein
VPTLGYRPCYLRWGRLFAYGDSSRYRTGANYEQLPVNRPINEVHNYNKDGPMRFRHNGNQPVYAPNSYGGPRADAQRYHDPSWFAEAGEITRTAYVAHQVLPCPAKLSTPLSARSHASQAADVCRRSCLWPDSAVTSIRRARKLSGVSCRQQRSRTTVEDDPFRRSGA